MDIKIANEAKKTVVNISGWLDTTTAPELEKALAEVLGGDVEELVLDLQGLEYTSSAGLRVILSTQKAMNKKGSMKLVNVCPDVMEVFDITGFVDFLTIE